MLLRLGWIVSLALLLSPNLTLSCDIQVTDSPEVIFATSDFMIITCQYSNNYMFTSFVHPTAGTLTSSYGRYSINDNDAEGQTTLTILNVVDSDEGIYHCSVSNSQQEDCSGFVTVVFDDRVTFLTQSGLTYHAFINSSVTLECEVMYHEEFRWQKGNAAISFDDRVYLVGTNLHFSRVLLQDAGTYSCFAENENHSSRSITAHLSVYLLPTVAILPQERVVNISNRTDFTCEARGYPTPRVVWSREDTEGPGLTTQPGVIEAVEVEVDTTTVRNTLTFFNVMEADTGTYRCTASNDNRTVADTASLQLFGTPSPPQSVQLTVVNLTNILVSWQPPLDDGHLEILEYHIMWFSALNLADLESSTTDGSARKYVITNLQPVTMYTVKIYAKNSIGRGKESNEVNITTNATAPAAPTSTSVADITSSSVRVVYTVSNDNGGAPIKSIRITYQAGEEAPQSREISVAVPPVSRSYQLDGLEGDTPYTIDISAGNAVGFGPPVSTSFQTLRPGYPGSPSNVQVASTEAMSVELAWESGDVGKPFIAYHITAAANGSHSEGQVISLKPEDIDVFNKSFEMAKVSGLEPETCYSFMVVIENSEGRGQASQPTPVTCTLSCTEGSCQRAVGGVQSSGDLSNSQLIPILVVVMVVAILIVLVVIIVFILSRKYARHRKYNISGMDVHLQNYPNMSMSSSLNPSTFDPVPCPHSTVGYSRQQSGNISLNSSITDPEEIPHTGSTTVSDNPFIFNGPNPNGVAMYGGPYPNGSVQFDSPQVTGIKTTGSYPLFPIPEDAVATLSHAHFPASTPAMLRVHQNGGTKMTENPAFENEKPLPPQHIHISSSAASEIDGSEGSTPPPIPPYRGDAMSDTESNLQAPHIHIQSHFHSHTHIPSHPHTSSSVPFLGESVSQISHSPVTPHPGFYLQGGEEEEEVEFMDNNAYESVTPELARRQLPSQPPQLEFESSSSSPQWGQGGSPRFGSREVSPSLASGPPRFEIASQERGLVFETVKFRNQK